jgi:hypothetical protein
MLRKSYPMRDHEDRRWSMREINSPEKPKAPEPQETQYVLRIARSLYDAHAARRAAHGLPPSPNLAPADEPPDPTAAPATPSPEQATPQSAPDEDEGEFPGRFSFRGNWPLNHHRRHCTICKHPFRTAIEEEFLHWASPIRFRITTMSAGAPSIATRTRSVSSISADAISAPPSATSSNTPITSRPPPIPSSERFAPTRA